MEGPNSQINPIERQVVLLLKKERLRKGISASKLAAKVGIDRSTITHLERNAARPSLWVLIELAHGLGHSLTSFIREAERAKSAERAAPEES